MCEVLKVNRSGFYKWKKAGLSMRKKRRQKLMKMIEEIFQKTFRRYGVRRVYRELRKRGVIVNRKLVQAIMHEKGLQPKRRRRFRVTTDSKHSLPVSKHRLQRIFRVEKANTVWVSDITYIDTKEGWLYLSTFVDLYSRKVVGWSMSDRMTADLVTNAYDMAVERRGTAPELVHSDRGSQYASEAFRKRLKKCKQSMSRKGNCWDNAVAESFFGSLKSELVHQRVFETRKEAEMSIFEYIEIFYNRIRLHSTLGYLSPSEFEQKGRKAA
jgi:transposase InsO family protein